MFQRRYALVISLFFSAFISTSCSPVGFSAEPGFFDKPQSGGPVEPPAAVEIAKQPQVQNLFSEFFKLATGEVSFEQPQLETNETTVAFQVSLPSGKQIAGLKASNLVLAENGVPVPDLKLSSNSEKFAETVDIVFIVDITGSMSPTIESAKKRLVNFVKSSRANGYRTRMCLITFGDYTVQKCARFYDNNPDDPRTETQVAELISEISHLKAYTQGDDPGGSDLEENPLRALMDAADAPWGASSQRFAILITDAGFLHAPMKPGKNPLATAPTYEDAIETLKISQIKVFAATPPMAGYNQPFQTQPGIVEASDGEWFRFSSLMQGHITLDTILNRIMNRVQTTYTIRYTADESKGLKPELPLEQRNIVLRLKSGSNASVHVQNVASNLPNGRDAYPRVFTLSEKRVQPQSVQVYLEDRPVKSGFSLVGDREVEFATAPPAKSRIRVRYQYQDLHDAVSLSPIVFSPEVVKGAEIDVFRERLIVQLNGQEAPAEELDLESTLEGGLSVRWNDRVLGEDDPYRIRENGGLKVSIQLRPQFKK